MIRVVIADDHAIVRRGLRQLIAKETDMTVVGEAADAQELLAFIRAQPCDLVVTDIRMPGRSGLQALKELKRECPCLPVLVLSGLPEEEYGPLALKLGASGYLIKRTAPEELVPAIRKVATGGMYVSLAVAG